MRRKILVVDDDADIVELLSFNLKKAGFAIGTASNGIEALKKIRSMRFDLILLDLMMPEMDGFSLCEILRRNAETASVPVIMLTALSGDLARLSGLESGANEYVTKPFSLKQLVSKMDSLLKKQDKSEVPAHRKPGFKKITLW
jgi:two-component system alkaline phosphatase synthesis response regulator PhoP